MKHPPATSTLVFETIHGLLQHLELPNAAHPLIALVDYTRVKPDFASAGSRFILDFYKISFKASFQGMVKYGPGNYDFSNGGMAFLKPRQVVEMTGNASEYEGYALYFHPDLIRGYPLSRSIADYGFFSYAVSEALHLSDKEKKVIIALFKAIKTELANDIDAFSQDVLVAHLELVLHHCNRFYNRQFITRRPMHSPMIDKMSSYLAERFNNENAPDTGLPTTEEVAAHLNVSRRYLSDMLKSLTGLTTQQHIHMQLIEKSKELLSQSSLSTAEIAYKLGFEHPQSFNKLFRQKTNFSPLEYRQSFN